MNIQGQTALVTGAASGLGEATARELARLGAKVAVLDINADRAERVAADLAAEDDPAAIRRLRQWDTDKSHIHVVTSQVQPDGLRSVRRQAALRRKQRQG